MEPNAESTGSNPTSNALPGPLPDREVVAQVALDLARVKADPKAKKNLAAVRSDIHTHGLTAFFHAAIQTEAAEQARATQEAQGLVEFGIEGLVPPPVTGRQGQSRQTWADCIASRAQQPLRIYHPATLGDLKAILKQAEASQSRVKAVGSGHSFTDVAGTRDFLVETHGLRRPLPLQRNVLRPDALPGSLFSVEAGITVRDLNEALWNAGLGLVNMGGYDGQTIAGVVTTSTHGSGLAFGPLSSQVVSMTMVAPGGRMVRVEPVGGITDPLVWAARNPNIELRQDDDWFNACQVGLGCMGIIYSVVLRVRPRYYLKEERTLSPWSQVKLALEAGQVFTDNDHYELLLNPYATLPGGDHTCLVTRRNQVAEPDTPPQEWPRRNFLIELAAHIPGSGSALLAVLNTFPWFTPQVIDEALQGLVGEYLDRSYRVYNIGAANDVPAYGSEIGFTMHRYLEAIERIFTVSSQRQAVGQAYLTSPFSLRFVKASQAHLSMMQGADTCMIEFIMLDHTLGGKELLQEIETEMYAFGGRPHWGLLNFISGAGGLLEGMYPLLPRWQAIRRELDPKGLFANAFSERCGLTPRAFIRS